MKNKVIKEEIKMSGEKMVRERETEINRNAIGHVQPGWDLFMMRQ